MGKHNSLRIALGMNAWSLIPFCPQKYDRHETTHKSLADPVLPLGNSIVHAGGDDAWFCGMVSVFLGGNFNLPKILEKSQKVT